MTRLLDTVTQPPVSTIINWALVLSIAVTLFYAADAANKSREARDQLFEELQAQGCIAVYNSTTVNITGDLLGPALSDANASQRHGTSLEHPAP